MTDKNSHEFKINKEVIFGDKNITLNKISVTPLNTTIYYTGQIPDSANTRFAMTDSRGMEVKSKGGSMHDIQFDTLNGIPEYINLIPYNVYATDVSWITQSLDKLPATIKQGEIGSITIERIEFLNDRTEVYYNAEGKLPLTQAHPLIIIKKDGNLIVRDSSHYSPQQLDESQKELLSVYPPLRKEEIQGIKTVNFDTYYKLHDPVKIDLM
jgi:hypothetical protein